jgi:pimeloyl-ACP methyl ester carboxylesterase
MIANPADWPLHESGSADAAHTVLLLPGGLCTAAFYDDVMKALEGSDVRCVAITLPGFAGTPPTRDLTLESHAAFASSVADRVGADVIVGHSQGANVALEIAATGAFKGPIVLLSPTFSLEDEMKEFVTVSRIGRIPILGALVWRLMAAMIGKFFKDAFPEGYPPEKKQRLIDEVKRNRARDIRRLATRNLDYFERYGSLADRLCNAGVRSWVLFGDRDQVGLADAEKRVLVSCPDVKLVRVPDASHMVLTDEPVAVADVILESLSQRTESS